MAIIGVTSIARIAIIRVIGIASIRIASVSISRVIRIASIRRCPAIDNRHLTGKRPAADFTGDGSRASLLSRYFTSRGNCRHALIGTLPRCGLRRVPHFQRDRRVFLSVRYREGSFRLAQLRPLIGDPHLAGVLLAADLTGDRSRTGLFGRYFTGGRNGGNRRLRRLPRGLFRGAGHFQGDCRLRRAVRYLEGSRCLVQLYFF